MSEKRQRLSSIDLLPECADADIVWVGKELRAAKRHKKDILAEFNARLADHGLAPISVGAFSRYSVEKAKRFRAIDQERRMSADLVESLGINGSDDMTVVIAETIKSMVSRMLGEDDIDSKTILELSRASEAAVKTMNLSALHREKLQKRNEEIKAKAIDHVAKAAGLSGERVKQLRRDFLGVKK